MHRLVTFSCVVLVALCTGQAAAQTCPGPSNCRADATGGGKLIHAPNSNGDRIWTSPCQPNTSPPGKDAVCAAIASCKGAGGFGQFLKVVTGDCKRKGFGNLFGLDGLTFGILDYTVANLPAVLQQYGQRNPAQFSALTTKLGIPADGMCVRPEWACNANRQGQFLCEPATRAAFQELSHDVDFQKAQLDVAQREYASRIDRYTALGLHSEFGNVAMAVLANNLKAGPACKPQTWKAACSAAKNEQQLLDCMFDQYVAHACRGTRRGSLERIGNIRTLMTYDPAAGNLHPRVDDIVACAGTWGK